MGRTAAPFGVAAARVMNEPLDWAMTINDWAHGRGSWKDAIGLLPGISVGAVKLFDKLSDSFKAADRVGDALGDVGKIEKQITVLGNRVDIGFFYGQKGYNVLNPNIEISGAKNLKFIQDAVMRGDNFLLATSPAYWKTIRPSSRYFDELGWLDELGVPNDRILKYWE